MSVTVQVTGVREALNAFRELPRRVRFRHLRIALNAAGGVIRDRAASLARRETGLLSKSIGVKVKIPDASFNSDHHGKPAYAVIGAKRRAGKIMRVNRRGKLKGITAANRELKAARKSLAGTLTPLKREEAAVKSVLAKNAGAVYRVPSRYSHLAERKQSFIGAAGRQVQGQAVARISEKLTQGIESERAALVRS